MKAAAAAASSAISGVKPRRESGGFSTLYHKELADHFHSARFKLVFALLILTSLASLYGALSSISDATFSSSEYLFLALYTASGSSIPSFASFLAYLAPLAGLAMGFDAINRERTQGTLNRLVSQPIHRDAVINAKFLAGTTVVFIMIFFVGIMVGGLGLAILASRRWERSFCASSPTWCLRPCIRRCGWACPSCAPRCASTPPPRR